MKDPVHERSSSCLLMVGMGSPSCDFGQGVTGVWKPPTTQPAGVMLLPHRMVSYGLFACL